MGWTPLYELRESAQRFGLSRLWLKDDGRNPTASFKDRASAVVVARAREVGADIVITASTGNAGAALAGMAAAARMPAVILAPRSAPPAKIAQLLTFGARVVLVDGNYDQAFDLSLEAAQAFGWYCRNTGYNPFTAEGKKTAAFEICEQLGSPDGAWRAPQAIFVSVGDGNIISGLDKGFKDLFFDYGGTGDVMVVFSASRSSAQAGGGSRFDDLSITAGTDAALELNAMGTAAPCSEP